MGLKFANFATSTLVGAIDTDDTTLSVVTGDAALFPTLGGSDWFPVVLADAAGHHEVMRATARAGAVITVARGQEGTAARSWASGDRVDIRLTRAAFLEFLSTDDLPLAIASGGTGAATALLARAALGLAIGTNVQAQDADLTAIAALVTAAYGRGLLTYASEALFKAGVNLEEDVDFLGYTAMIKALRDVAAPGANKLAYLTGAATWALTAFTAAGRTFVGAADQPAQQAALGLGDLAFLDFADLVYAGSSAGNVDYPVGSSVLMGSASVIAANASATVRHSPTDTSLFISTGVGAALTGTWRARGAAENGGNRTYQMERTA